MMKLMTRKSSQRGMNLLEVLVGIAIFALGILALVQLQGDLARSSADASARTAALNIAEEAIEAMRSFSQLESDPDGEKTAFNDIVNESETRRVGGIDYLVSSNVTDYYFDVGEDNFGTVKPDEVVYPDMKKVELTVSWSLPGFDVGNGSTDSLGSGSVTITDLISSITAVSGAKIALNASTSKLYAPPVGYNPGQNPDIIAIELGDNKFKESTTPLPDVIRQNELVETKFDVVTYLQSDESSTYLRREEFLAVSCQCTLKASTSDAEGGRRPTVWDGVEYTEGEFVAKAYGVSASNQQSIYCDLCCRDHHDGGTGEEDQAGDPGRGRVNPFRDSADYWTTGSFDGDHKHYRRDHSGNLSLVTTANVDYVEACRLIRKDGFFRVAQDMRQEGLNSFPASYLDEESEIEVYSDYVTDAVQDYEGTVGATDLYEANPPTFTQPADMTPPVTFPASSPSNATLLPTSTGAVTQQLRNRGIYIDYLTDDLRTIVNCLDLGGTGDSCGAPGVNSGLEVLPFFDVQLTWLARWNETPTNNPVDVSNEAVKDGNVHSRGMASLGSGFGTSTVDAKVHAGNLGLTGTDPIDPYFAYDLREYDLHMLANTAEPPPATGPLVSGTITSAVPGVKASDVEITAVGAQCDRTSTGFDCYIELGATEPTLTVSNYAKMNRVLYACSSVLTVIARQTATPHWTRFLLPTEATTGANIVIREDGCD